MTLEILIMYALGAAAGVLGGLVGLAGRILIVPALVFFLSMPQQNAVGTTLAALLPPVGLLGALEYNRHGQVNFTFAMIIAAGLLIGADFCAFLSVTIFCEQFRPGFAIFFSALSLSLF